MYAGRGTFPVRSCVSHISPIRHSLDYGAIDTSIDACAEPRLLPGNHHVCPQRCSVLAPFWVSTTNECERTRASTFSIQRIQFCRVCKRCRCWYGCPARAWHAQICCSSRWRILMAAGLHIHSERHTIACKERLNISTRQVQRLVASFNRPHACSIISTSAKRRSHSTHASAHVRTHARTHTGT